MVASEELLVYFSGILGGAIARRIVRKKKTQPLHGKKTLPLHGARIEDYALIGDCETAALVSREGSIDWLCWPTFSSAACFAALLGTAENGFWRIRPVEDVVEVRRRYRPGTMIVETTFVTKGGEVCLTDFMPPRGKHSDVVRMVHGVSGKVKMHMDLVLRFDYGLTVPWVTKHGDELQAVAGPDMVVLRSQCLESRRRRVPELVGEGLKTVSDFVLREGRDKVCFTLTYGNSFEDVPAAISPEDALKDTHDYWCEWSDRSIVQGRVCGGGAAQPDDAEGDDVSADGRDCGGGDGGIAGEDWRGAELGLSVLLAAGYGVHAAGADARGLHGRGGGVEAVAAARDCGIAGAGAESVWDSAGRGDWRSGRSDWLPGYENSKPVRIGNAASEQFQLDVYGEVVVALSRTPDAEDDLRTPAMELEAALIDHLCHVWQMPDEGIWETRGGAKHFVHSKVMAWMALDRAVKRHERL